MCGQNVSDHPLHFAHLQKQLELKVTPLVVRFTASSSSGSGCVGWYGSEENTEQEQQEEYEQNVMFHEMKSSRNGMSNMCAVHDYMVKSLYKAVKKLPQTMCDHYDARRHNQKRQNHRDVGDDDDDDDDTEMTSAAMDRIEAQKVNESKEKAQDIDFGLPPCNDKNNCLSTFLTWFLTYSVHTEYTTFVYC